MTSSVVVVVSESVVRAALIARDIGFDEYVHIDPLDGNVKRFESFCGDVVFDERLAVDRNAARRVYAKLLRQIAHRSTAWRDDERVYWICIAWEAFLGGGRFQLKKDEKVREKA